MASTLSPDQTLTESLAGPVPDYLAEALEGTGPPKPKPVPAAKAVPRPSDRDDAQARERQALMEALAGRRIDQLNDALPPAPAATPTPAEGKAPTETPTLPPAGSPAPARASGQEEGTAATPTPDGSQTAAGTKPDTQNPPDPLAAERQKLAQAEAELARERQRIEEDRARLRAEVAEIQIEVGKVDATAADYDRWAAEFERDGDDALAQAARERAAGLRQKAKTVQTRVQEARTEKERNEHDREAVRAHPELQDPKSEFSKAVLSILKGAPALAQMPNGLRLAAEHVAVSRRAQDADALKTRLAETEKRLAERERLLQPGIGAPPAASAPADFDNLPKDAQREAIRQQLRAAEEQGARLL
jgi:hypothetical protein